MHAKAIRNGLRVKNVNYNGKYIYYIDPCLAELLLIVRKITAQIFLIVSAQ